MSPDESFSTRHGYTRAKGIRYRGEIPVAVRSPLLEILLWYADPKFLWQRIGKLFSNRGSNKLLRTLAHIPGANEEDSSATAVRRYLVSCPWFQVYDLVEDVFAQLSSGEVQGSPEGGAEAFQHDVNEYFVDAGIGWQLADGKLVLRGQEILEGTVKRAAAELQGTRPTVAKCINDALQALSQRPEPNLRGAIVLAMGALETTAREIVGEPKASLDEIVRQHPGLLPKPIATALSQLWTYATKQGHIWGYADSHAWYVEEGREPMREEAEMVIGLVATVATYLARKYHVENR